MSIIVFDFDDTLFPSTYYDKIDSSFSARAKGKKSYDCEMHLVSNELIKSIELLLEKASRYGTVYIITNASESWLRYCFQVCLPGCNQLKKILENRHFVYSSCDNKEILQLPQDCSYTWKTLAFKNKLGSVLSENKEIKQLIAFGDTEYDRLASLEIKKMFPKLLVKNIKFHEQSTLCQLVEQHSIVISNFDWINSQGQDVDYAIKNIVQQPPQQPREEKDNSVVEKEFYNDEDYYEDYNENYDDENYDNETIRSLFPIKETEDEFVDD